MFFKKNVRIVIKNKNTAIEVKTGANLYDVLVDENIISPTLCRGNGQCGKCKVKLTGKHLAKPTKKEQLVLAKINLESGYRLACETIIKGELVVDTSEISFSANSPVNDVVLRPVGKKIEKEIIIDDAETDDSDEQVQSVQQYVSNYSVKEKVNAYSPKDGLLFVQMRGQVKYFLYSAVIDGIAQSSSIENVAEFTPYIENGMLSDYIHDVLKIKDIDRLIILSDEPENDGEHLFDTAAYVPFDIGAMPCELIRPLPEAKDLTMFLRILAVKGKNKILVPLDKLNSCYYFGDNTTVRLSEQPVPENLFELTELRDNPIVEISDDLKKFKAQNEYEAPDSVPLGILLKIAAQMHKIGIIDSSYRILSRTELTGNVSLEYVVKIVGDGENSMFFIHRDKGASLAITQDVLDELYKVKKYVRATLDYVEQNLGNIDSIILHTPVNIANLANCFVELGIIPKRHENNLVNNSGDSAVIAVKLFQQADVRGYIGKNFGTFTVQK